MDVSDEEWHALFELNVMSAIRVSRGFIPSMQSQKWGPIINVTSENCVQPDAVAAQYSLTKAALTNLTESLSTAFAADNILVNAVSPAFVMTPMVRGFIGELAAQLGVGFDEAVAGFLKDFRPHLKLKRPVRRRRSPRRHCSLLPTKPASPRAAMCGSMAAQLRVCR
jgi:3-oxoacyl-[acyl-carrier protein] reductase